MALFEKVDKNNLPPEFDVNDPHSPEKYRQYIILSMKFLKTIDLFLIIFFIISISGCVFNSDERTISSIKCAIIKITRKKLRHEFVY